VSPLTQGLRYRTACDDIIISQKYCNSFAAVTVRSAGWLAAAKAYKSPRSFCLIGVFGVKLLKDPDIILKTERTVIIKQQININVKTVILT